MESLAFLCLRGWKLLLVGVEMVRLPVLFSLVVEVFWTPD
jgi:hypothetical protein